MKMVHEIKRMRAADERCNPVDGRVVISPVKSLWFVAHFCAALTAIVMYFSWINVLVFALSTALTLCLGHTIGLHRLLIHRSFSCSHALKCLLVHLGTLVGMGGPFQMLYLHDIRDWAQRHPRCHALFIHRNAIGRDALWQLFCEIRLTHPPVFEVEPEVAEDRVMQWLQRTWMWQQLPYAALLFLMGGIGMVLWGISARIVVSILGHWLIGYFAHNCGQLDWRLEGHAVQGYNLPHLGLLTMGESWHNNHHAFPESAQLGIRPGQSDPGWWVLCAMERCGWIWNLRRAEDLPAREERTELTAPQWEICANLNNQTTR